MVQICCIKNCTQKDSYISRVTCTTEYIRLEGKFTFESIYKNDVDKYFLRVECDHLLFSTTVNEKDYYVTLYLFGTVVAEKTIHKNKEREIQITLAKAHKWTEWLRLHIEEEKNVLIVADPDRLYKNNWLEDIRKIDRESFAEYKRRNNITNIMPDVPSTDEEESDDDAMDMLFV